VHECVSYYRNNGVDMERIFVVCRIIVKTVIVKKKKSATVQVSQDSIPDLKS
jgi:hypothetical protein